jgi:4,4'-diaponeurosporenoate glycosyltransferase
VIVAIGFFILSGLGWYLMWRIPTATPSNPIPSGTWERVSIVIPARNEEHRIAPLLRSIQEQQLPIGDILVVDDESTDGTAEIARSLGATVIPSRPLPSGWRGKSWASHQGAQAAKGDLLVFLDADTSLEPGGLDRL